MERHAEQLQKDLITTEIVGDLLRMEGNATAYLEFVRMELDHDKQLMQTVSELSQSIADGVFQPVVNRKKYAQAFEYGAMLGLHVAKKELPPHQFVHIGTTLAKANNEIDQAARVNMMTLDNVQTEDQAWEYWRYFFNHSVLEEGINNYENAEKYQFIVNEFSTFFADPDDMRLEPLFHGGFGYMYGFAEELKEARAPRHAA